MHLELSAFCSQYLLSPPFESGIGEDDIISYARKGSYALQDYAVQHWLCHLREGVESSGTLQSAECQDVMHWAHRFLQSYGDHAKLSTLDDAGEFPSVTEMLNHIPEHGGERNLYFNIEERTEAIRQPLRQLGEKSLTSEETKILSHLHGPFDVQKCSKPWCELFKGNLHTTEARQKHIRSHDRPFRCLHEGCPFSTVGYSSTGELQKHNSKYHTRSSNRNRFPRLATGTSPHKVDKHTKSQSTIFDTLILACARGDESTIWKTLKNCGMRKRIISKIENSTGYALIHFAAKNGHARACIALLGLGADARLTTTDGKTALLMAAGVQEEQASFDTCSALIAPSDVGSFEAANADGHTAFELAVTRGHVSTVQLFLDQNRWPISQSSFDKALLLAASTLEEQKSFNICSTLMRFGANVKAVNADGDTVLHVAVTRRHVTIVKLLLDRHPESGKVLEVNADGHTAFELAVTGGHVTTVQLFLDQRSWFPSPSVFDKALLLAASNLEEQKSFDICSVLINSGARPEAMNADGDTALHVAVTRGHVATVKLLLDKHPKSGKVLHAENKKRETPSSLACQYGHFEILMALDEYHGHYHAPFAPKECHKLMEIASLNHHDEIVKYLFKKYPYLHLSRILLNRIPQAESKSETRSEEFLRVLSSTENLRIGAEILELVIRSREFRHLFKELLKSPKLLISTSDWYCLVSKIKGDVLLLVDLDEETKNAIEGFKHTRYVQWETYPHPRYLQPDTHISRLTKPSQLVLAFCLLLETWVYWETNHQLPPFPHGPTIFWHLLPGDLASYLHSRR